MPNTLYAQELTNQLELMQTWAGCELFWVPGLNSLLLMLDGPVPADHHEDIRNSVLGGCVDLSSRHVVTNLHAELDVVLFESLFSTSGQTSLKTECPQTQLISVGHHATAHFSMLDVAMDHIAKERGLKREPVAMPLVGLRKVRILEESGAVLAGSIAGVVAEVERPDGVIPPAKKVVQK
jgi:hypothetical protein